MRKFRNMAAAIVVMSSLACATAELNAYRSLGSLEVTVDAFMKIYATQVVAGKVSAAEQATVKKLYSEYQMAMLLAKDAVTAYKSLGGPFASVQAKVDDASHAAAVLQQAVPK